MIYEMHKVNNGFILNREERYDSERSVYVFESLPALKIWVHEELDKEFGEQNEQQELSLEERKEQYYNHDGLGNSNSI